MLKIGPEGSTIKKIPLNSKISFDGTVCFYVNLSSYTQLEFMRIKHISSIGQISQISGIYLQIWISGLDSIIFSQAHVNLLGLNLALQLHSFFVAIYPRLCVQKPKNVLPKEVKSLSRDPQDSRNSLGLNNFGSVSLGLSLDNLEKNGLGES